MEAISRKGEGPCPDGIHVLVIGEQIDKVNVSYVAWKSSVATAALHSADRPIK